MISIQELTKQTGITVRTLRFYDRIGLLPPAGKTEGGHRLYGEKEIQKLQEIQFLKSVGFRLQQIDELLSDPQQDWLTRLQQQRHYVSQEKEKLGQIESILNGLLNQALLGETMELSSVHRLIQLYQQDDRSKEAFLREMFTRQEYEQLEKLPNLNRDDPDTLEWIALLAQLKKHQQKGAAAPEVQRIIRRIHEKEQEAFGANPELSEKLWEIRKSPEKSEQAGFYPIEQELLDFIDEAFQIYMKAQ